MRGGVTDALLTTTMASRSTRLTPPASVDEPSRDRRPLDVAARGLVAGGRDAAGGLQPRPVPVRGHTVPGRCRWTRHRLLYWHI